MHSNVIATIIRIQSAITQLKYDYYAMEICLQVLHWCVIEELTMQQLVVNLLELNLVDQFLKIKGSTWINYQIMLLR